MTSPGLADAEINSIVTAGRLNRFMSSPHWTDEQWEDAVDRLEGVESTLAGKLNSPIKPIPYSETVTILRTGQLNTTYPVSSVTTINGATVVDGVLPGGWTLRDHRLYSSETPFYLGQPFTLSTFPLIGEVGRVDGLGAATVAYQAGWGNVPALRLAILKKARTLFTNTHDDSVTVRDLDANQPSPLGSEEWTDAELKDLEIFRNLVAWR